MPILLPKIEKVLLSKLKSGDYPAFTTIFTAYYADLLVFASKYTHDIVNSEEIVQNTFVKLWERHKSLNINSSLKSFLFKTVQNECIDWFRHKKIIQRHSLYISENQPQYNFGADSILLYSELKEHLNVALQNIPLEYSQAFRMNREQGLKYHEIAEKLNVSVRTIEVRVGKAIHMLRESLKEYLI